MLARLFCDVCMGSWCGYKDVLMLVPASLFSCSAARICLRYCILARLFVMYVSVSDVIKMIHYLLLSFPVQQRVSA